MRFGARPGYRFLQVAFPPLDPGSGLAIGPQRTGKWVMRRKAVSLTAATERCTTSVFVDSDLTMRISVEAPEASAPVQVQALLNHNGVAVTNAQVRLTLVRPARSLAQVQTPAVIARALNADRSPIAAGESRSSAARPQNTSSSPMGREATSWNFLRHLLMACTSSRSRP